MPPSWYVLRIKPRSDTMAASSLERDGFQIFFPKVLKPEESPKNQTGPLFPGYLFIRCDPENGGWPVFRSNYPILGWLKLGNDIPSLPDHVVNELEETLKRINQGGGLWRRFSTGDQVRVTIFGSSSIGEVIQAAKSPEERIRILVKFMGRNVKAQVPSGMVQPLEDLAMKDCRPPRRTRGKGRTIRRSESHILV